MTTKKQDTKENTKGNIKDKGVTKGKNNFTRNLGRIRKNRGLKQEEVATALGMPPATYSSWERGRTEPSIDGLLRLARYFDVSVDTLLSSEFRALKIGSTIPAIEGTKFHPIKFRYGIYDHLIYPLVFNRLYFFDIYERRFHMELIDSWRVDNNNLTYTFYLRSNVRFHHGGRLELEDVKASYELFFKVFPFHKQFITSVAIREEEHAIELKLSKWLELENLPAPYIIPASYTEKDECFEGTGPFRLAEEEQRKRVREGLKQSAALESNNAYFGKMPAIQAIEFHRYNDGDGLRDGLEKSEVDLAYNLDLDESDRFNTESGHGTIALYLILGQDSAICRDKNARNAIDFALDRDRIVKGIKKAQLLPNSHLYLILREKRYSDVENNYDLAKAKECWKEALDSLSKSGITDPILRIGATLRVQGASKYSDAISDLIDEIIEQLKEAGINAEQETDDSKADALVSPIQFARPFGIYMVLHSPEEEEETKRFFKYSNPFMDSLLDNIEGMDTYRKIQEVLTAEHFFLPLFRRGIVTTYTKDLDTKSRIRGTNVPYGPDVVHWEFK